MSQVNKLKLLCSDRSRMEEKFEMLNQISHYESRDGNHLQTNVARFRTRRVLRRNTKERDQRLGKAGDAARAIHCNHIYKKWLLYRQRPVIARLRMLHSIDGENCHLGCERAYQGGNYFDEVSRIVPFQLLIFFPKYHLLQKITV